MITAQDIREKTFEKSTFGGYAMNEVDDFLDELAGDLAASQKETASLRSKMKVLEENVRSITGNIANLKNANREIVDSIAHLSASSEEIAAGSQNVTSIAINNEEEALKARDTNNKVIETANQLNKYRQK